MDASRDLLVDATTTYPYLTEPKISELFSKADFASPTALGTVLDQKLGLQSKLFNSWARSVADGAEFAIGGAVDSMQFTTLTEALIGTEFSFAPAELVDNAIRLPAGHGLVTGQPLIYDHGGGENIGGLTDGATYYAILDPTSPNQIQLAALGARRASRCARSAGCFAGRG